jgi:uncharacterized membrane protein
MAQERRRSKTGAQDYERRKLEVGRLLEIRSRQTARKISLRYGGKKRNIRAFRRRIMFFIVLASLLGVIGILKEFFF